MSFHCADPVPDGPDHLEGADRYTNTPPGTDVDLIVTVDFGDASRANFEAVQAGLRRAEIAFTVNPRLVRGLDYYNLTVFEWVSGRLGAQNPICSGGRYDGLFEQLGGKPTPGCGFGIGVERTLLLLEELGAARQSTPDAYLAHQGEGAERFAFSVAERLRAHGLAVVLECSGAGFRSQLRKADASGARYAVIVGEEETLSQRVSVKPLRETAEQTCCTVEEAANLIAGPGVQARSAALT